MQNMMDAVDSVIGAMGIGTEGDLVPVLAAVRRRTAAPRLGRWQLPRGPSSRGRHGSTLDDEQEGDLHEWDLCFKAGSTRG